MLTKIFRGSQELYNMADSEITWDSHVDSHTDNHPENAAEWSCIIQYYALYYNTAALGDLRYCSLGTGSLPPRSQAASCSLSLLSQSTMPLLMILAPQGFKENETLHGRHVYCRCRYRKRNGSRNSTLAQSLMPPVFRKLEILYCKLPKLGYTDI